jgi:hypothetical protein
MAEQFLRVTKAKSGHSPGSTEKPGLVTHRRGGRNGILDQISLTGAVDGEQPSLSGLNTSRRLQVVESLRHVASECASAPQPYSSCRAQLTPERKGLAQVTTRASEAVGQPRFPQLTQAVHSAIPRFVADSGSGFPSGRSESRLGVTRAVEPQGLRSANSGHRHLY